MITFKQFISEKAIDIKPKYKSLAVKTAIKQLNTHCKNALWMLAENRPLYRGENYSFKTSGDFLAVDTAATVRKSQNTSNFYTLILDNNPLMKDFPKRSRSFIGTTSESTAGGYSSGLNKLFVMIPFDDTKVGFVNDPDMWSKKVDVFGYSRRIESMNDYLSDLHLSELDFSAWEKFDAKLKAHDPDAERLLLSAFPKANPKTFLRDLFNAYSPKALGFSVETTSTMPHKVLDSEVWVGGKVMMIRLSMWKQLREAFKVQNAK